ncbi:MAG: glycosyltransferase family 39 protein [Candidatus Diapherotrites archaeon]
MKHAALLGLGLILLAYSAVHFAALPLPYLWSDEALYVNYISVLGDGSANIFSPVLWEWHPPLFSLISSFFLFFFEPLDAARFTSFLFGAASIILAYLIARRIGGNFAGLSAAVLLAFSMNHFLFSSFGLLDIPLAAFVLLVAYSLMYYADTGNWKLFAASLLLALFIKWPAIVLIPFSLLYLLYLDFQRHKGAALKRAVAGHIIIFAVLFCAAFLFVISFFVNDYSSYAGFDFSAQILRFFGNVVSLVSLPVFLLFVAGILAAIRRRTNADIAVLFALLAFSSLAFFKYSVVRYLLPILPLSAVLAGAFLSEIRLPNFKFYRWFIILLVLSISFTGVISIAQYISHKPDNCTAYAEVSSWLLQNIDEDARIYAYSDREFVFFLKVDGMKKHDGEILMLTGSRIEFEDSLASSAGEVIVIIDNQKEPFFKDREPGWLYRMESYGDYLSRQGFTLAKRFEIFGNYGPYIFEVYSLKPPNKIAVSAP